MALNFPDRAEPDLLVTDDPPRPTAVWVVLSMLPAAIALLLSAVGVL